MQNWLETLKDLLLLSDEDVDSVRKGDFKTLLNENRDGLVRVCGVYAALLLCLFIFLSLFFWLGGTGRLVLMFLFFSVFAVAGALSGKEAALRATRERGVAGFVILMLAFVLMRMFSDVSANGSGPSQALMYVVFAGAIGGGLALKPKLQDRNWADLQIILTALSLAVFVTMMQSAFIRMTIDANAEYVRQYSERQRAKQAEEMRKNSMSAPEKACTSEEECKRMNMKKNDYYIKHEAEVMATCENAVAKEITSRFEWTVSPADYKFTSYQVDVLNDEITVSGDRVRLIDAQGNKTPLSYRCRYNVRSKTTDVTLNK